MILIKSFLKEVLYDFSKHIFAYLNERGKVCECYRCLKVMIQAHLQTVFFFTVFFIKRTSLIGFYLYMELVESSTILKQKNNHEVPCN